jgi:TM2 domain-containing membrane protein YozV
MSRLRRNIGQGKDMSGNYPPQGQWPPRQQQQWPPQPQQQYPPQPQQQYPPQPQQQYPPQPGYGQQLQPYQQPPLYASSLYGPQPYQPPVRVAPKSPALGLFLGLLLPGLGCMASGRPALGICILGCWLASLLLIFAIVGWVLAPACWIWSGIAGYKSAQSWNRDRGIIS